MRRILGPLAVLLGIGLLAVGLAAYLRTPSAVASNATQPPSIVAIQASATTLPLLPTLTATPTNPALTATPLVLTATVSATATVPAPTPTVVNLIPLPVTVSGVVMSANGPLGEAMVQLHGENIKAVAAKDGTFTLTGLHGTTPVIVTAWSEGFYVGSVTLNPSAPDWKGSTGIKLTLKPLASKDNNLYDWFSFNGVTGSASCALCHRENKEWQADAHSQSAQNQRFITIYTGTDVNGRVGQPVILSSKGIALPPDPSKPYYGPGFQLDNPNRAGNCAACHTPVASKTPNQQNCAWGGCHTSLTIEHSRGVIPPAPIPLSLKGNAGEGISCEFCHKVGDVILNPKTKLPLPDMPGILSMRLYRPADGQQIFFGTLVDVPRRVSYSPLESKSEFCAPCHYGVAGGVVGNGDVKDGTLIYNSYGEWLNSPYSDAKTGKTCQQCHMLVSDAKYYVFADKGGLTRDYAELHNHTMPGATDENLLQNAVTMKSTAERSAGQVNVDVLITNDQTGHSVPTDSPLRSMILVVEAVDANGKPLTLTTGPVNPDYSGNYGGQPGKTFAKILRDDQTGEAPTAAQWRAVTIISDTRLAAMATDASQYRFAAPDGAVTIKVHLIYRRAFQLLQQQKGWTDPDIVMEEETIPLAP